MNHIASQKKEKPPIMVVVGSRSFRFLNFVNQVGAREESLWYADPAEIEKLFATNGGRVVPNYRAVLDMWVEIDDLFIDSFYHSLDHYRPGIYDGMDLSMHYHEIHYGVCSIFSEGDLVAFRPRSEGKLHFTPMGLFFLIHGMRIARFLRKRKRIIKYAFSFKLCKSLRDRFISNAAHRAWVDHNIYI